MEGGSAQPEETSPLWNIQSGTFGFYPWPWARLAPPHLTLQRGLSPLPGGDTACFFPSRETSPSFFLTSPCVWLNFCPIPLGISEITSRCEQEISAFPLDAFPGTTLKAQTLKTLQAPLRAPFTLSIKKSLCPQLFLSQGFPNLWWLWL